MRRLAARGVVINGAFDVTLTSLALLRGFIVAAFLSTTEYGTFGILAAALGTLLWLKQVGVGDKYVQQRDEDQERAFQLAFTLELILCGCFFLLVLAAVPIMVWAYDEPALLAPGLVCSLSLIGVAFQTPIWPYYRSMDFLRQRTLQAVDPLIGFAVTIGLAIAGAGYWSLVIGLVSGSLAGAAVAIAASPYPLRLRWEPETLREYVTFSWPLLASALAGVVIAQSATLVAAFEVGLAGVGALGLASSIVAYTNRVDQLVTNTLYPAICAVRDRADALAEAFVKSNRLAVSFGLPFGVGLALFAEPLIDHVLGDRWLPALGLIHVFAVIAAVDQIGFNWTAFYRAIGRTRPIAVVNVTMAVVFVAVALPLLVARGLDGLAIGMVATTASGFVLRAFYIRRLFPHATLLREAARAMIPTALGAAAVLLAAQNLVLYVAVVVAVTWLLQGSLMREALGYLARRTSAQAEPATRPA